MFDATSHHIKFTD